MDMKPIDWKQPISVGEFGNAMLKLVPTSTSDAGYSDYWLEPLKDMILTLTRIESKTSPTDYVVSYQTHPAIAVSARFSTASVIKNLLPLVEDNGNTVDVWFGQDIRLKFKPTGEKKRPVSIAVWVGCQQVATLKPKIGQ
jgi:hypothetical protein